MDAERLKANRKRSKQLSYLNRKNLDLADEIEKYMRKNADSITEEKDLIKKLVGRLRSCSYYTLYGQDSANIRLVTPKTCKHKLCNICNWHRQKKIRRKYFHWFENNQTICKISKGKTVKYCTHAQLEKYLNKGFNLNTDKIEYDLMHLTLTVPHTKAGWKGSEFYLKEQKDAFHALRRLKFWKNLVYGGEYGIESTINENGFHIHIHALLMVRKQTQSRNLLHFEIFKQWNRLSVNEDSKRKFFRKDEIDSIKVGNKLFTDEYVNELSPNGATLIGLECIYTQQKQDYETKKIYTKEWGSEAMIKAVLETISYHFKPKMFYKYIIENGEKYYLDSIDIEKVIKIIPKIHGQTMYWRMGVLEKEPSLGVKDDTLLEDFEETTEDIDEETGEVLQTQYFITNPLNVYSKGVNMEIAITKRADARIEVLRTHSGREAVQYLNGIVKNKI